MKGLILAGGFGTRLYPATGAISKQLLLVGGKPLIYYPLSTLIELGIADICLITTTLHRDRFMMLLGDGSGLGIKITYTEQDIPGGIADALRVAEDFIDSDAVTLILGDNIFGGIGEIWSGSFGVAMMTACTSSPGADVLAIEVAHPERYGVIEFGESGRVLSITEKPKEPRSRFVIPGIYLLDGAACQFAKELKPSARGELEITDLLNRYLHLGRLKAHKLDASKTTWFDCGTPTDLHEASAYIHALERRTGKPFGSPELASWTFGNIGDKRLRSLIEAMPACEYREALQKVL